MLLRIAAVVLVVAFLGVVVRGAMIAFGSAERNERRIDGAVEKAIGPAPRPRE